jgi:hypothetical protein
VTAVWISRGAVFLGALLLFVVQPMAARSLLPWYGGAPMVWAVALFFFQAVLLLGYLYAHLLVTRLAVRMQAAVHALVLIVAGLLCLPPLPDGGWAPPGGETPAGWILTTLLVTLGPAFFALAATTPLVSAWVARTGTPAAAGPPSDVYRLYALSNAGSLIGLVLYPLLLEPLAGLAEQGTLWSGAFAVLAGVTVGSGYFAARAAGAAASSNSRNTASFHPAAFALAAVGSLALVAVTTHLTRDVAAVPFLWVAPLALYLLTFVLAFRGGNPYPRRILLPALLVSVAACFFVWFQDITYGLEGSLAAHAGAALTFLFAGCWVTHGEIALRKPEPSRLTGFYLSMTAGGALGGLSASLVSPLVFPNVWEYPLALVLAVLVAFAAARVQGAGARRLWWKAVPAATLGVAIAISALEHRRPLFASRNFFGVVRVMEAYPGTPDWRRDLWHGGIAHGSQWFSPGRRREPTLYYYEGTGIEGVLTRHPKRRLARPLRVAVVGLGTGSILVHAQRDDLFRFYEIDPQVVMAAREFFTYLADTTAEVEVVLGDGRLSLQREEAAGAPEFDVIVLDAFAGDAIPMHLLTAEAFELYRSRLAHGGVLAVHISNRHVDLAPVIRAQALQLDLISLLTVGDPDLERFRYTATWILLSLNADFITDPSILGRAQPWTGEAAEPAARYRWTDDHSNLLDVLR